MDWLEANTGSEGHVGIEAHGQVYDLPVARFDNRVDKTSFIRDEPTLWKAEDVAAIHSGLRDALTKLAAN